MYICSSKKTLKKWLKQKVTTLIIFIAYIYLTFSWFDHFQRLGQKYKNIFIAFFFFFKSLEFAFEINCPLAVVRLIDLLVCDILISRIFYSEDSISLDNLMSIKWLSDFPSLAVLMWFFGKNKFCPIIFLFPNEFSQQINVLCIYHLQKRIFRKWK